MFKLRKNPFVKYSTLCFSVFLCLYGINKYGTDNTPSQNKCYNKCCRRDSFHIKCWKYLDHWKIHISSNIGDNVYFMNDCNSKALLNKDGYITCQPKDNDITIYNDILRLTIPKYTDEEKKLHPYNNNNCKNICCKPKLTEIAGLNKNRVWDLYEGMDIYVYDFDWTLKHQDIERYGDYTVYKVDGISLSLINNIEAYTKSIQK